MRSNALSLSAKRRSMALVIWSLLVVTLPLIEREVTFTVSILVLLIVSALCVVALLLIDGYRSIDVSHSSQGEAPFIVSMAIFVTWAFQLGSQHSMLVAVLSAMTGIVPLVTTRLLLTSHSSRVSDENSLTFSAEPFAHEPIMTVKAKVHPGEETQNSNVSIARIGREDLTDLMEPEPDREWQSSIAPDVTQWLKRLITSEGETIEGGIRVSFNAGQRDATVHVSFCPSFQSVPELTTEILMMPAWKFVRRRYFHLGHAWLYGGQQIRPVMVTRIPSMATVSVSLQPALPRETRHNRQSVTQTN